MEQILKDNSLTIIAAVMWLVSVIVTKRWGDIKTGMLTLIVAAEEKYGLYDNEKKLEYVLNTIYSLFPNSKVLKLIPKSVLKAILEGLLTTLKVYTKSTTEKALNGASVYYLRFYKVNYRERSYYSLNGYLGSLRGEELENAKLAHGYTITPIINERSRNDKRGNNKKYRYRA